MINREILVGEIKILQKNGCSKISIEASRVHTLYTIAFSQVCYGRHHSYQLSFPHPCVEKSSQNLKSRSSWKPMEFMGLSGRVCPPYAVFTYKYTLNFQFPIYLEPGVDRALFQKKTLSWYVKSDCPIEQ